MAAAARLDLGFLIRREHVLVLAQRLALEAALVQVQNTAGLGREVWGPREDPGVVPPRLDGILGQPAAQRRGRDRLDQPAADDLSPQLLKAPAADRNATGHWQFTGDRLDLGHDGRREHPRPAGPFAIPESVHPLRGVALAPLGGGIGCDPELAGDPCIGPPAGGQQHDPGPGDLPLLRGWLADQRLEPPTLRSPERDLKRTAPATACHCTAPPLIAPSRTQPHGNPAGYGQHQAGGISEHDPMPATIPESTKISLGQRLRERQQTRWPALATVHLRFRGQFAYVDGESPDQQRLPLCRLRYGGSASRWGFAIYLASRDGYEDSILP